jgi:hypothetical protein
MCSKSTCLVWLSDQIDQMLKWLVFGLIFLSNKPWFFIMSICEVLFDIWFNVLQFVFNMMMAHFAGLANLLQVNRIGFSIL